MANVKTPSRPSRASINGLRLKTEIKNKEPGFYYKLTNDIDDRIQNHIEAGYEIVTDSTTKVGDKGVANTPQEGTPIKVSVGNGIEAYVMRIKEAWRKEDRAEIDAVIDKREAQINREAKENKFYGEVKISRE